MVSGFRGTHGTLSRAELPSIENAYSYVKSRVDLAPSKSRPATNARSRIFGEPFIPATESSHQAVGGHPQKASRSDEKDPKH